jgi:hypothetical protein|tara:strand:+ start:1019 stop:1399 length:381 start_codon:yes stop_codon:yes gene_type:complete
MAYSGTVTKSYQHGLYEFKLVETEAATASETAITGVPDFGVVIRQVCQLTAGSGSTVDPVLGTVTNPAGATLVVANGTAAAICDNLQAGGVPYKTVTANTLYHRSVVSGSTDNAITTIYYIQAVRP